MTNIKDIGGEFSLIEKITRKCNSSDVLVGIGDDAAVVLVNGKKYVLTTDMFVEDNHFSLKFCSWYDIGWKCVQGSVSDVCAMGGTPTFLTVAGSFPPTVSVEDMEEFSRGMYAAASMLSVSIVGGDTTRGKVCCFCVTVMGSVVNECLRSHAQIGDFIVVSGDVGRSHSGLSLLQSGFDGVNEDVNYYRRPQCAGDFGEKINSLVHAMIDVSDGVASEVKHICKQSGVGAVVVKEKLPLHARTVANGLKLGVDPATWALSGGEDFVLLFTVSPDVFSSQKDLFSKCTVIGQILDGSEGIWLEEEGVRKDLGKGYNHFSE
jgi:thiamine-monophosphate kinase